MRSLIYIKALSLEVLTACCPISEISDIELGISYKEHLKSLGAQAKTRNKTDVNFMKIEPTNFISEGKPE